MTQTPLLVTGLNGLVGSVLPQVYPSEYIFESVDISDRVYPTDITDYQQVLRRFTASSAQFVLHLAAFTDVNAAWQQKGDKQGLVYKVNVEGTENILKAAAATGKHVIHVSTAFVFNGQKDTLYTEEDSVDPIEWYGHTKAEAEQLVQSANTPWTILRIDFPFRYTTFAKPDIVRKTVAALEKGYPLFDNHFFGPTVIEDFARIIDWVVRTKTTGLFNASSGEKWSDYQLGEALIKTFSLPYDLQRGDLEEYLKTLQRPYQRNTALDTSKLTSRLDFKLMSIEQALKRVELPMTPV